ncbi:MAG: hypothetical protein JRJ29_01475 [Deltaproteobacteria bacterium]|nr:hypothetical protein [Deltaproteobacteria bacterium]
MAKEGIPISVEALIADGIHAAYERYARSGGGAAAVPFLFTFIDYLIIAMPPSTTVSVQLIKDKDIFIESRKTDSGLEPPYWEWSSIEDTINIGFTARSEEAADSCKRAFQSISKALIKAKPSLLSNIAEALQEGLPLAMAHQTLPANRPENECLTCWSDPAFPKRIDQQLIEVILDRAILTISEGLSESEVKLLDIMLVRHCNFCEGSDWLARKIWSRLSFLETSEKSADSINAAFNKGFIVKTLIENERLMLYVPCHFGGVPWLVLGVELANHSDSRWLGYSIYRDVVTRLNDSLRLLGISAIVSELEQLFIEATQRNYPDYKRMLLETQASWAHLACVYPIRRPFLRPVQVGDKKPLSSLRIGDGHWTIDFCDDISPTYLSQFLLEAQSKEKWGTISADEIIRMSRRLMSALGEQQEKHMKDLASGVYKIGHPLKDRIGPIREALGTINYLFEQNLEKDSVLPWVKEGLHRLRVVEDLGHLLDMSSRAIAEGLGSSVFKEKAEWHSSDELSIKSIIGEALHAVGKSERHEVYIPEKDLEKIKSEKIRLWIEDKLRPADLFYREILTEIFTNAARSGRPDDSDGRIILRCLVEVIPDQSDLQTEDKPCLIFQNVSYRTVDVAKLRIIENHWAKWDISSSGAVGGLYFLAMCLQVTKSGAMFAHVRKEEGSHDIFSIGLCLKGFLDESGNSL